MKIEWIYINEDKNIRREIEKRFKNGEEGFLWEYDYSDCNKCSEYDLIENLLWIELYDDGSEFPFNNPQTYNYDSLCEDCFNELENNKITEG